MIEEEKRRFYANNPRKPTTIKVVGKFGFNKIPRDVQKQIKERLAERDPVMLKGLKGELPGLKINGKQVTRENIHEFEIKPGEKPKIEKKKEEEEKKKEEAIWTKEELNKKEFSELREIGDSLGVKGRSKRGLIKDILGAQK